MLSLPNIEAGGNDKPLLPAPSWVQQQLPHELMRVMERRWLEDLDAGRNEFEHDGGDINASAFLRIQRLRHGPDRLQSLHPSNMLNVLSSLSDSGHSLIYALRSDGADVSLHMGLRDIKAGRSGLPTAQYAELLRRVLRGNFPGIELSECADSYATIRTGWLDSLIDPGYLACITGIPSRKADAASFFTQSVDRLVGALRGESYTLLILAEPIDKLAAIQDRIRALSEEVHTLVRRTRSESRARSESLGQSTSTMTSLSAGLGGVLGALVGFQLGRSAGTATNTQDTATSSLGASYEQLDKTAQYCETLLEEFQSRLQRGRNLGFWNVGVFLASDEEYTFLRARGVLRGLYTGQGSYVEPLRIVDLSRAPADVTEALEYLRLPRLVWAQPHPIGPEFFGLGTPLATDELAVMMSLPHHEVPGLKLAPTADFNLNPPAVADGFKLGTLLYHGEDIGVPVRVSAPGLTRHTFVAGLTGAGKTNTCLALLSEAYRHQGVNFLVIDPAKTEYRFLAHTEPVQERLLVFTLGDESVAPFRLNPFEFQPDFSLLGHIDLVKAVFNAAFPMYASMPYLLEEAILAIYQDRGWDIAESYNPFADLRDPEAIAPYWPQLSDLYAKVDAIVSSKRYGAQLTQDISAALKARLGSLLNGHKGRMLNTPRSTPFDTLLEHPVVLELRGVPDEDEKAFIMALIFIRLYEACRARPLANRLRHLTLIEEAHRLLRHVPAAVSAEAANPRGKTVEMFADMMAEMRVYGEGFVIVDQMPSKLIPDVVKGSNLKIIHRLLALEDRAAVGNAMSLSPSQMDELTRLRQGQAIVHSEELEEACRVHIAKAQATQSQNQSEMTAQETQRKLKVHIQEQMQRFYADHRSTFYQQAACYLCDAPCTYQPANNQPDDHLLALGQRFLIALHLAEGPQLRESWRTLETELQQHFVGRSAGHARCGRVLLAAAVANSYAVAYPSSMSWQHRLGLQTALAELWEHRVDDLADSRTAEALNSAVRHLRALIRQGADRPRQPRPGCGRCPVRCRYGQRLQLVNNAEIKSVVAQFANLSAEQPPDWDTLRRLAVAQFNELLPANQAGYAAYCLLTQVTADASLLAMARALWVAA